jgi:hypothetical protein
MANVILKPRAKLALTALLFVIALVPLVLAASTHSADPLFFMWIPLLAVPWVLTRPEAPDERLRPEPVQAEPRPEEPAPEEPAPEA